jgi:hypothetical protein
MPLTTPRTGNGAGIERMVYSLAEHTLTITTLSGECAVMEIDQPGGAAQDTSHRVVYLDQCHWSTIDRCINDPGSVTDQDDVAAADRLVRWALDRSIVLPLSSGHVMETTPLFGEKRRRLALTMLQLSHGWNMRNPLIVRRQEIACVLDNARPGTLPCLQLEVFTLEADSLYTIPTSLEPELAGIPGYLGWLCARLSAVLANFDLLIDPERIVPEKPTGWGNELTALGRDPEFQGLPPARRRVAAQARALIDAIADLPVLDLLQRSGLAQEEAVDVLLQGLQTSTDTMPFLRLYADALGVRLSNRARWEPNDLVDMLYLSCAAAYADAVAAERAATHYLNAAWRDRPEPCPVVPTLRELVSHLTDTGLE